MRQVIYVFFIALFSTPMVAQFGAGFTFGGDCYQRYVNPDDSLGFSRSSGSAILNMQMGPKIWIGGSEVSFSLEGTANIGFLALGLKDRKGMGALSFPILARLNFKGLSALDKEGRFGLSIGGGIQWNRTELYGLRDSYEELGVNRSYFKTYVGEIAYGFGLSGFSAKLYARYGRGADKSSSFNFGICYDFNINQLSKIKSKNDLL